MTRLLATLENATYSPLAEIQPWLLVLFACVPSQATLTRVVVPAPMSRRNTSPTPLVSPATRFVAGLKNATYCPLAEIELEKLGRSACAPPVATLTSSVVPD